MCFYEQHVFKCGDSKWGNFRQHCNREYRTGETCGMKLVFSSNSVSEKCKLCEKIDTKSRRMKAEKERICQRQGEPQRFSASISRSIEVINQTELEIRALECERNRRAISFVGPPLSQDAEPHQKFRALSEGEDQLSVTRYRHIKWWRLHAKGSVVDDNEMSSFQSFCDHRDDESDKSSPSDVSESDRPESTAPSTVFMSSHSGVHDPSIRTKIETGKTSSVIDAVDEYAVDGPPDRKQDNTGSLSREDSLDTSRNPRGFSPIRITWRCSCGHLDYDDYLEFSPGVAKKEEEAMFSQSKTHSGGSSMSSSKQTSLFSRFNPFRMIKSTLSNEKDTNLAGLPQHENHLSQRQGGSFQCCKDAETSFLLLCIDHGRFATTLVQVNLFDQEYDSELLKKLRKEYHVLKGKWTSIFSLRTVTGINFVQLELQKHSFVDIRKINDIPPPHTEDYRYAPRPAERIPPIGPRRLMHLWHYPDHAADGKVCLQRFPKKLRERLRVCPQQGISQGWGIYFVEGLHWNKVWLLGFIGFVISTIVGICWSVIKYDVQGGFGISAFLLMFWIFTLGTIQASLELR